MIKFEVGKTYKRVDENDPYFDFTITGISRECGIPMLKGKLKNDLPCILGVVNVIDGAQAVCGLDDKVIYKADCFVI